ncbi:MAG TPA: hypothetical protein PKD52_05830 [Clostridiales bacterium]|nr:hypothetical protein [Clostridiales bacterium]
MTIDILTLIKAMGMIWRLVSVFVAVYAADCLAFLLFKKQTILTMAIVVIK